MFVLERPLALGNSHDTQAAVFALLYIGRKKPKQLAVSYNCAFFVSVQTLTVRWKWEKGGGDIRHVHETRNIPRPGSMSQSRKEAPDDQKKGSAALPRTQAVATAITCLGGGAGMAGALPLLGSAAAASAKSEPDQRAARPTHRSQQGALVVETGAGLGA